MYILRDAYVEIRRIAFDSKFDVFGLNLTVEELRGGIRRQRDVDVDLFERLIPLENLLI